MQNTIGTAHKTFAVRAADAAIYEYGSCESCDYQYTPNTCSGCDHIGEISAVYNKAFLCAYDIYNTKIENAYKESEAAEQVANKAYKIACMALERVEDIAPSMIGADAASYTAMSAGIAQADALTSIGDILQDRADTLRDTAYATKYGDADDIAYATN